MNLALNGLSKNPIWIIREYASAKIPCSIFNAALITENPFESFHKRGDRHDDIDNVAVLPKDFDAVESFLEPGARKKFFDAEDALVAVDTTPFDLNVYRQDWAHRLVHDKRAVLLKQARNWFHIRTGDQPNNLCGPLAIMGREHNIIGALTKQVFRIQNDGRARLLILLPAPIRYLPMLRLGSKTMDHLVFHPATAGGDA